MIKKNWLILIVILVFVSSTYASKRESGQKTTRDLIVAVLDALKSKDYNVYKFQKISVAQINANTAYTYFNFNRNRRVKLSFNKYQGSLIQHVTSLDREDAKKFAKILAKLEKLNINSDDLRLSGHSGGVHRGNIYGFVGQDSFHFSIKVKGKGIYRFGIGSIVRLNNKWYILGGISYFDKFSIDNR